MMWDRSKLPQKMWGGLNSNFRYSHNPKPNQSIAKMDPQINPVIYPTYKTHRIAL